MAFNANTNLLKKAVKCELLLTSVGSLTVLGAPRYGGSARPLVGRAALAANGRGGR